MADLSLRLLADAGGATGAFKDFGSAVTAAGAIVADFAKESVKAFMEAEKIQKQLARAAGENTEAFTAMADAMSAELAIEDEHIKQLQTLALNYEVLPQNVEGATRSVLNWSVATGKDARGAMLELIKAVEAGTGSLDRGRITFEATGNEAEDMARAIDALNKKFGGAAAADADTLEGRARGAEIAVGELKETVGGFFGLLEQKLGLLDKFTTGLRLLMDPQGFMTSMAAKATPFGGMLPSMVPGVKAGAAAGVDEFSVGDVAFVGFEGKKGRAEFQESALQKEAEYRHKRLVMAIEAGEKEYQAEMEVGSKIEEYQQERDHEALEAQEKLIEAQLKANERHYEEEDRLAEAHQAEMDRKFERQTEQWRNAGDRMGAAMVDAIGSQLIRLVEGGEVDSGEIAGDIASTVLTIAGTAIGSYFGMPQLGASLGGLAGGLAKAGFRSALSNKKHDGGWIERFHSGGWPMGGDEVPAMLQTGERVLSRREVGAMGGPRGVDAAARGRGAMTVNINALDAQSFQESFGDRGGRGFFDAIRVGRGDLVPLFG